MRSTSALCFKRGQRVEEEQLFQRDTDGLAAFSMHAFELLQLTLKGGISFIGGAHDALRGQFIGSTVIRLRVRFFESVSENARCGR